jgi:hypothetical protein
MYYYYYYKFNENFYINLAGKTICSLSNVNPAILKNFNFDLAGNGRTDGTTSGFQSRGKQEAAWRIKTKIIFRQ